MNCNKTEHVALAAIGIADGRLFIERSGRNYR